MRFMLLIPLLNACIALELQSPPSLGIDKSIQGEWMVTEVSYDGGKTASPLFKILMYATSSAVVFPSNKTIMTTSFVNRATHEGNPGWFIQFSNSSLTYLVLKTSVINEFTCLVTDMINKKEDMRFVFRVVVK